MKTILQSISIRKKAGAPDAMRRLIASLLVMAECFSLAAVGAPVAYAQSYEPPTELVSSEQPTGDASVSALEAARMGAESAAQFADEAERAAEEAEQSALGAEYAETAEEAANAARTGADAAERAALYAGYAKEEAAWAAEAARIAAEDARNAAGIMLETRDEAEFAARYAELIEAEAQRIEEMIRTAAEEPDAETEPKKPETDAKPENETEAKKEKIESGAETLVEAVPEAVEEYIEAEKTQPESEPADAANPIEVKVESADTEEENTLEAALNEAHRALEEAAALAEDAERVETYAAQLLHDAEEAAQAAETAKAEAARAEAASERAAAFSEQAAVWAEAKREIEMTQPTTEDEQQPATEAEQQPAAEDEQQPAAEAEQQPAAEAEQQPAAEDEQQPVTEAEQQHATEDEQQPAAEAEQQPATEDEQKPAAEDEQKPAAEAEQKPTAEAEQQPTTEDEQQPATEAEQQPDTEDEQQPAAEAEQQPTTEDEHQPAAEDEQQPATEDEQQPITEDEQQPIAETEQQPETEAEQQPETETEQQPETEDEQQPADAEQQPTTEAEQQPAAEAEQQPETEDVQQPATEAEQQPETEDVQQPATEAEQQHAIEAEQQPTTEDEQQPAAEAEQQPETEAEQQPATEAEHQPATEDEQQPETEDEQQPAAEGEQLPTTEDKQQPEELEESDASAEEKETAAEWTDSAETSVETDGNVSVAGNMPAGITLETNNVTESFADFDPSSYNRDFFHVQANSFNAPAFAQAAPAQQRTERRSYSVLAAYDVTLRQEEKVYQPEGEPLELSITDPAIREELASELEVWHIHGDGAEQVEAFTVEGNTIRFPAESFSVYAVVQVTITTQITTSDGYTYSVSVTYDQGADIPENVDLAVRELGDGEKENYVNRSAAVLNTDAEDFLFARAFDISLLDPETGEECQPASGVKVSISLLDTDVSTADELNLLHFGEEVEPVGYTLNDGAVEFETDGFSVYVLVSTTVSQTLTASDGNEYLVTVTYDNTSGIPADAELVVRELKEGDEGYDEYVAAAAEKLGEPLDNLAFARPFDITLKNPQTDKEYQPTKNVQVSIRLLNKELNEYTDVDVIHFPGEADGESEILNASINGDSVKFKTDGFSVYVLTGVQDTLRTYYFYSYNEYGEYASFFFYTDDQNTMTDHLTIKNGEKLFAPHDPTHPTDPRAVFIGWFEGTATNNNTIEFSEKPFDFSKEQNINKEDGNTALTVHLYAKFSNVARVNFHGQYDADTGSYPIVETFMGTLEEGQTSISVPVDNYKAGYYSTVDGAFPKYKFYGWSADPIEVPGEGQTYKVSSPMNVVGSIDLYPIYVEIRWLSYNSGNAGTGATYFAPVSFPSGDGLAEEDIKIPTRQGYTFTGWYLSVESQGTDAQNGTGLQLTDSVGKFADHAPSELSPYGISITTDQETGKKRLYLSGNREIYAGWDIGTADYKIVVWKERNENSGNYDWAESFTLQAQPGDVVTVVTPGGAAVTTGTLAPYEALNANDSYNAVHTDQLGEGDANPYADYLFDGAKTLNDTTYDRDTSAYTGTKTVAYDNTTVVNLYYSRTSGAAETGNYTLKFDFLDAADGDDVTYTVAAGGSFEATLGEAITLPTAADMNARPGYEFVWYADESCTARVFFDQDSYDSYTDGAKVLYTAMPDHDLTVYGNWEKRWYLIQIDPNYGALYAYNDAEPPVLTGNGSTYFFKSYQGDYIQEYTWVTRDYVASESGNFYYVNHDYDYVRKHGGDRYTYYTKNLEEATEYTTYKYKKGAYLYDGWYQVNEDGTETPYTFGQPITGNIKLRLHWKLAGTYYLEYNADVTVDGKRLIGSVGGGATLSDPNPYRDQAGVTIEQTAEAPEGYTFVGWRVRGDNTGTIYYPGSDFALPAEHAVTMGGKERVFLDAVYGRVATATVIYDANGGSITDTADAGYPYSVDNLNHPVLNGEGKPVRLSHKVERDVTGGTVTVSGVVNNSPVLLSSGVGFTAADTMTGAVLAGWNTQPDGGGTHFDLGDEALLTPTYEAKIYLDTAEPVTLYAEWKITVTFTKNSDDATWNGSVWTGYVSDSARLTQNDAGDYVFTTYVGAKLKEPPEGVLTRTGQTFDFWSKEAGGDETGAFDFATETLSGSKTLYAHWTQATLVPFHISDGTEERADWQKTPKLRVNDDGIGLALTAANLANYTQAPEGYAFRYACLGDNGAGVSETQTITAVSIVSGEVRVTKQGAAEPEPLGERKIWLVYLPDTPLNDANVKIVYVKEDNTGNLTQLSSIQYNGAAITLNGQTVAQNQTLTVDSPKIISQIDENGFRLPPLLDDGEAKLSRVYYKIGVGNENTGTVGGLGGVSESLELYLRTRDNKLQWSFDDKTWTDFTAQMPTVYAIYRERGYELTLKKSVIGDDTGISPDETFRVTITSYSITRDSYSVEGTGYTSVEASPASASAPGTIDLSVKDGSEIKIIGLASGSYTITETGNDGYEVAAKLNGTVCNVSDPWTLSQDTTYELSNTPQYLCRIQNPQTIRFYTLNRALEYAESEMNGTATIELLRDYTIPSWDAMEIPAGFNIKLRSKGDDIFTITRDEEFLSAPMISSSGTLTLENITLDGNSVQVGCPMVQSMGTLTLNAKTTLRNAESDSNGGAIEVKSGTLTMADNVMFSSNSAVSGGAVYVNSGAVTVTGGSMSGNRASSGGAVFLKDGSLTVGSGAFEGNTASVNGGAIYAVNGTVTVNGGTFGGASEAAGNTANGSGGAIYAHSAVVTLISGTVQNNKAASGGAIYMQVGQLAISGGSMTKNSATSGNGGAVYMDSGNMSLSGGSMTKNSATNGSGGAVYVDAGTINHSAGTIGGTVGDDGNTAVNGAGVFVNKGAAEFSGTAKVTYNTATNGGAVGVGTEAAKLNFAGTVQIKENTLNNKASNVYLNLDSGDILNFAPLSSDAYIGIYVPGEFDSELFKNRGTVCARFAGYTDNQSANADFKSYVKNDRLDQVEVAKDTATNKLYWYRSFTVQALSLDNNVLPNGTNGLLIDYNNDTIKGKWYNPPASVNRASVIAEDFPLTKSFSVGTRVFAGAYICGQAGSFGDYVTRIYWDNAEQKWKAVKRDNTTIEIPNNSGDGSLMLYYANAAYLSIENNSDYKLALDAPQVKIGGDALRDIVDLGYGYVVAKNGATQNSLEPITQEDLTLDAHGAIKFLLPGAVKREFKLTGRFTNADGTPILWNGQITYTLTGVTGEQLYPATLPDPIPTDTSYQPDPLDINKTLLDAGKTYEIIFGGKKVICKIVNDSEISGLTQGTDYVEMGTRSDGKVEYRFDTLNQAVSFARNHKKTATIELLTDYLIPTADNVSITDADCKFTFTTALRSDAEAGVTGMKVYPGTAAKPYATISRDAGNTASLIKYEVNSGDAGQLTVTKLNFDGKNLGGSNEFGAIKTNNIGVNISHSVFLNFKAKQGGAVSVDYIETYSGDYGLTVDDCIFKNCESQGGNRVGGGAIWTCAKEFRLKNSNFENCKAADQGGAVFHRIDALKKGNGKSGMFTYAKDTKTYVSNCQFVNCQAGAAGGLEMDTYYVEVTDCTFRNCVGKSRNAGAVNIYFYENGTGDPAEHPNITDAATESGTTEARFVGCTFDSCSSKKLGGGIRTQSQMNWIEDCTFKNCYSTNEGGAISLMNNNARSLTVSGCTIDGCYTTGSNKAGGGIYCNAGVLTIGDYDYAANNRTDKIPTDKSIGIFATDASGHTIRRTKITGCTATGLGGGIAHAKDNAELTITNATIYDNKTSKTGGGVSTKAKNVTITGGVIEKNTATGNGGGVYVLPSDKTGALILDGCKIRENVTNDKGGGVYTEIALTLKGNAMITANRLTTETKENAAGVYQPKDKNLTLTVGEAGAETDSSSVRGNVTASGAPSNLVLSEAKINNKVQNAENSVEVLCNLSGKIYVINAKYKGAKFGVAKGAKYLGFKDSGLTELEHTFIADDNTLFGVFDRMDEDPSDGYNIIWRGDVICKLTDAHGRLLYLNEDCSEPAIFDRLNYDADGSRASPFSYLRDADPQLWYYNESNQITKFTVAGNTCCVKLLVSSYDLSTQIKTGAYPDRTIILTTAGRTDSLYPFTGTGTGSRATINRGSGMTKAMIDDAGVNLTLRNIVLDGKEVSVGGNGALIYAKNGNAEVNYTITLAESAMLQNGKATGNGGGVYVENCSLDIAGGTIYNCSAAKGGGVRKVSAKGTVTFSSGLVTRCTATGNTGNDGGGGIAYGSGAGFTMSGSAQITRCSANNGGGVFIDNNNNNRMDMTGGSITQNTANNGGGGIYPAGTKVKLYFSGRVTVSGNKLADDTVNNVELKENNTGIINSKGIQRGSYIGVYVSGTYIPLTEEQRRNGIKHDSGDTDPYMSRGGEGDRFGTYESGTETRFLYFFVNDRNGLKGGLKSDLGIYWTTIFSLEVGKRVTSTDPDDQNEDFTFTVTLSGVAEHNAAIMGSTIIEDSEEWESDGSVVKIQNGTATFTLKNGQSRRWNNLPAGITYKVTENLDDARKAHYTTLPGYEINGTIGENLYKDDVGSKYLSTAVFTNLNAVCKLTLDIDGDGSSDALLYEYDANDDLVPAVYSSLKEAFDKINSGAPFKFLNKYVSSTTWQDYTAGSNSYLTRIEMLIDSYDLNTIHTLDSGKQALLTTAEKGAEDGYPYAGTAGDSCDIIRKFNDGSMFTAKGSLTLTDIVLDGNKDGGKYASANGGIVMVNAGGVLNVQDGAVLKNSKTTGYGGGAIRVENNGTVTVSGTAEIVNNEVKNKDANGGAISVRGGRLIIDGGTIKNNTVSGNNAQAGGTNKAVGGAIYVHSTASATISGGTIQGNTVIESSKAYGGAVYVEGTLTLSGGTINGNTAAGSGAGIYLMQGSKLNLSGNPNFGGAGLTVDGNLDVTAGNFTGATLTDATNGGKAYTRARQDIFIEGTGNPLGSINVTGALTSGDGTIWVWAEEQEHYDMLKQFAVFSGAGTSLTDPVKETTMKAFRNARPDSETNCGGDYLTGQKGETANYIYWTGGFDNVFMKIDGFGDGLSGATFTLYTDEDCTNMFQMSFSDGTKSASTVSSDGTATYKDKDGNTVTLKEGEVLLSKVPPKTFYMKEVKVTGTGTETGAPTGFKPNDTVYQATVSDKGVLTLKQKNADGVYEEVYKVQTKAAAGTEPAEYQYRILNLSTAERKVILRKVTEGTYAALSGAVFQIERADGSLVSSGTDTDRKPITTFTSGANGVYFIDKLPFGVYYLHEMTPAVKWFFLVISNDTADGSRNGVYVSEACETLDAAKTAYEAYKAASDTTTP